MTNPLPDPIEDDHIVRFVAFCEGYRSAPYLDAGGKWTVGYGFTYVDGEPVKRGTRHMDRSEAYALLREQLHATELLVAHDLEEVKLAGWQYDALTSFVFNVGHAAWLQSTMLSLLRNRQTDAASAEFPRWCHVDGLVNKDLVWRRYWERHLFDCGWEAIEMFEDSLKHAVKHV